MHCIGGALSTQKNNSEALQPRKVPKPRPGASGAGFSYAAMTWQRPGRWNATMEHRVCLVGSSQNGEFAGWRGRREDSTHRS
jgi:hypothetical protein